MFRLNSSSLYDQSTFYGRFYKDLRGARHRVVIERIVAAVIICRNRHKIPKVILG